MRSPRKFRKLYVFAAILLPVMAAAVIFLSRAPVLIVTDLSFNQLYGDWRLKISAAKSSFSLFRRVIPVVVSETAGAALVSLAVEDVSPLPHAVLFPGRYLEGARHYRESHSAVPVIVVGDGGGEANPMPNEEPGLFFVRTDTANDFLRAGLCAAFLTKDNENGKLVFLAEGRPQEEEAFREGLSRQGFLPEPVFVTPQADFSSFADAGCVVITGQAVRFFEQSPRIPTILFSWIDPALCPISVALIFDDSPWALAVEAVKSYLPGGGEILLPSRPLVLRDSFDDEEDFRQIQRLSK